MSSSGAEASDGLYGSSTGSISADGRYVAFSSYASNLVAGDTNGAEDVFVHDRVAETTERVNVASDGTQGNDDSSEGSISADGRYVAFASTAYNLVVGDTNRFQNQADVFVRDRTTGTTERVSVASDGAEGYGGSSKRASRPTGATWPSTREPPWLGTSGVPTSSSVTGSVAPPNW